MKSEPLRGPPRPSPPSPRSGISILMTLAPQSASWRTQVGPERTRVRSSTVKRDKAAGKVMESHRISSSFGSHHHLAVVDCKAIVRPSRRALRALLRMRESIDGTNNFPHPEEAALRDAAKAAPQGKPERPSRRTRDRDPRQTPSIATAPAHGR